MAGLASTTLHMTPTMRPMSWVADLVLLLQAEGRPLSPELEHLVPLAPVVIWAQQHHGMPTWREIAERWNCDRATAFRWLPSLRRAREAVGKA